jgi:hypothetical protein
MQNGITEYGKLILIYMSMTTKELQQSYIQASIKYCGCPPHSKWHLRAKKYNLARCIAEWETH